MSDMQLGGVGRNTHNRIGVKRIISREAQEFTMSELPVILDIYVKRFSILENLPDGSPYLLSDHWRWNLVQMRQQTVFILFRIGAGNVRIQNLFPAVENKNTKWEIIKQHHRLALLLVEPEQQSSDKTGENQKKDSAPRSQLYPVTNQEIRRSVHDFHPSRNTTCRDVELLDGTVIKSTMGLSVFIRNRGRLFPVQNPYRKISGLFTDLRTDDDKTASAA